MMTISISPDLQRNLMNKEQHLKEARENLKRCAAKGCYSPTQITALRLFVENMEKEFKCIQAMSEHA